MIRPRSVLLGAAVAGLVLVGAANPVSAAPPAAPMAATALRDELVRLAPPGGTARVDPVTGKVVVRVPGAAPTKLAHAVGRHAGRVVVETDGWQASQYAPIIGGHEIDGPIGGCTAGFNVSGPFGNYVLTAGHCTTTLGTWRRNGVILGYTGSSVNRFEGDFGLVTVTSSFTPEPKVNGRLFGPISTQPVWGVQSLPVNPSQLLCKMGRTTGYTCGSALAYDVSVNYGDFVVGGLIETNLCGAPGDSGGPLFTTAFVTNPPAAYAVGLVSGGNNAPCGHPQQRSYFQPVQEALTYYGMTLRTA